MNFKKSLVHVLETLAAEVIIIIVSGIVHLKSGGPLDEVLQLALSFGVPLTISYCISC